MREYKKERKQKRYLSKLHFFFFWCLFQLSGALVSAGFEVSATVVHDSLTTVPNPNGLDASSSASTNKKTTDHLVDWLTNVPEHEL